jgi:hypothetical protein
MMAGDDSPLETSWPMFRDQLLFLVGARLRTVLQQEDGGVGMHGQLPLHDVFHLHHTPRDDVKQLGCETHGVKTLMW